MEQAHRDALNALAARVERAERAHRVDVLQGLFAHFKDKAEDYGVYFFDPEYYVSTYPFNSHLQLVTNYVDDPVSALFTG